LLKGHLFEEEENVEKLKSVSEEENV